MKKWFLSFLSVIVIIALCACADNTPSTSQESEKLSAQSNVPIAWDAAFGDAGFTEDEIESYRKVFDTVGVTDFHDVTIVNNDPMTIVCGKIYDSEDLQLNVTLEDRQIIYVELAGIPDTDAEAYLNWRGKLKWKKVNTKKAVDLYSDTEGGYLAVLDWDSKTITEYEG